jgi:hypothetical protein
LRQQPGTSKPELGGMPVSSALQPKASTSRCFIYWKVRSAEGSSYKAGVASLTRRMVCRLVLNSRAKADTVAPSPSRCATSFRCSLVRLAGLPKRLPSALARLSPAWVRSITCCVTCGSRRHSPRQEPRPTSAVCRRARVR